MLGGTFTRDELEEELANKLREQQSDIALDPSPYSQYHKDVRHLRSIDVYRVLDLFGVTDQAVGHAVKKLLCAGQRGAKGREQDLREAHASIGRALQMIAEDCDRTPGVAQ